MFDPAAGSWQRADAFLSSRIGRWGLAAIVSAAFAMWTGVRMEVEPYALLLGFGFLFALIHADLWLWRWFRARYMSDPTDPYLRTVYGHGVFGWGVLMWISMALFHAYAWAAELNPIFSLAWMEATAYWIVPSLLFGMYLSLAAGYLWGRVMAAFFGIQRSRPA